MEYEQVEYGRRVVTEAIISQDINDYYDILSPQVLLVTHFPYPSAGADSNMQAVHRWVQMSERQHIAAVDAASAAAAAAAAAASSTATGGRGSVNINARNQFSAAAVAPAPTAGACSARSQKRRARELLQRQEQWRITQQQRYDSFRKLRELHHSCVADEGAGDNDVGGTGSTDGAARDGNDGAAAISEQCAADGRGAPAAPQLQRQETSTDKQRRGEPFAKATSARDHASNGGGSATAAAAARAADGVHWFQQQQVQAQLQPPEQRTRSSTFLSSDVSAVSAAAAAAAAAAATAAQKRSASCGNPIAYEDAVTITEGKLLVSFRFFQLLHWIVSSDGKTAPQARIAPIEVDIQLRKDILQEAEVLAPPPAPTTVQEAYSQLGQQFTERNQPLSCVRIVWGTDHLLFDDKIFLDDGLIVTIHRRMLTVAEVLTRVAPAVSSPPKTLRELPPAPLSSQQTRLSEKGSAASLPAGKGGLARKREQQLSAARSEQVYHAVEVFYGITATRVDACSNAWALLDFSFVKATEPSMLLRLTPVSGHVHVNRLPRAAADPRLSQGIFLNQENDPTKLQQAGSSRTLIKARNKYGEEEAYEFQTQRHGGFYEDGSGRGAGGGDEGAPQRNGNRALGGDGGAGAARYDASCVRVSGCHMQAKMDQLVPVLRRLVVNCLLTLHTLDLSQNNISSLPDLSVLPLQSLRLHGNAIADWRVVEARIAPLPYLGVLTLHGNPIAEDTEIEAVAGNSSRTAAQEAHCAGTVGKAAKGGRADGDSNYWKRLLALLLRSPDRVAPLRQVDFVTLTGQDYNMAGAYEMFVRGQTGLLAKARSMMGSRTQTKPAGATTKSSSKGAHVMAGRG